MAHPRMYAEDDPRLAMLRRVCLGFPESAEVEAWGLPTFRAGKRMFAVYSGEDDHPYSMIFRPDPEERPALVADSRFHVPPYFGPSGWLGLDLTVGVVDWEEIAELVDGSYRQVALKRMLRALDG